MGGRCFNFRKGFPEVTQEQRPEGGEEARHADGCGKVLRESARALRPGGFKGEQRK